MTTLGASRPKLLDTLLMAAAAATIAPGVAALGAHAWWGFELATHFRVQYLAAQLPLLAVLLVRRRRWWSAAVAAFAVLNLLPLLPYLPVARPAQALERPADGVTLVTANVEWRNDESARLLDIVAAESPDLLLVLEFTAAWRERLRPLYERYPHRILLPQPGARGVALLSRYALEAAEPIELGTMPAVDAIVAGPQGPFRLIGVHLRAPTARARAAERNAQLDELAALCGTRDGPLIVAGDFNSTPFSPYFAAWTAAAGLRDARRGRGLAFSWPAFMPLAGIPIDHFVVSPEWRVARLERLPSFGSDHYPVLIDLSLEPKS